MLLYLRRGVQLGVGARATLVTEAGARTMCRLTTFMRDQDHLNDIQHSITTPLCTTKLGCTLCRFLPQPKIRVAVHHGQRTKHAHAQRRRREQFSCDFT